MSTNVNSAAGSRFKIGWAILLGIAALTTVGHFTMIFFLEAPTLFTGYASFNLYAFIVLLIPYRHVEKWAWYATWIFTIGLALAAVFDPNIAVYYYTVAALCILGQLLCMPEFFRNK